MDALHEDRPMCPRHAMRGVPIGQEGTAAAAKALGALASHCPVSTEVSG